MVGGGDLAPPFAAPALQEDQVYPPYWRSTIYIRPVYFTDPDEITESDMVRIRAAVNDSVEQWRIISRGQISLAVVEEAPVRIGVVDICATQKNDVAHLLGDKNDIDLFYRQTVCPDANGWATSHGVYIFDALVSVVSHELGHVFGLNHAEAMAFGMNLDDIVSHCPLPSIELVDPAAPCKYEYDPANWVRYGDTFSFMGRGAGMPGISHMAELGLLPDGTSVTVVQALGTQTVNLTALGLLEGTVGVKVPYRIGNSVAGLEGNLWIEYRESSVDPAVGTSLLADGVQVTFSRDIGSTPATFRVGPNKEFVLPPGASWSDPNAAVTIRTISIDQDAKTAQVEITLSKMPDYLLVGREPTDRSYTPGDGIYMNAASVSYPNNPTVQWQRWEEAARSWTDIPGATSTILYVPTYYGDGNDGARFRAVFRLGDMVAFSRAVRAFDSDSGQPRLLAPLQDLTIPANGERFYVATAFLGNPFSMYGVNVPGAGWPVYNPSGSQEIVSYIYSPGGAGTYSVTVSNSAGVANQVGNGRLTVVNGPVCRFYSTPTTGVARVGDMVTFRISASLDCTGSTVRWERRSLRSEAWEAMNTGSSWSYTVGPDDHLAQVRAVMTVNGQDYTSNVSVIQLDDACSISKQPLATTVRAGAAARLTVEGSPGCKAHYAQWEQRLPDGSWEAMSEETGRILTFAATEADDGNQYRVVLALGKERVTSEPAVLHVSETSLPADPTLSSLSVEPTTALNGSHGCVVADGSDSFTVKVITKDSTGELVGGESVDVTTSPAATLSPSGPYLTGTSGDNLGEVEVRLTSTVAGSLSLDATLGTAAVTGSPTIITFCAGPMSTTNSKLEPSAGSAVANGTASRVVTATLSDAHSNALVDTNVVFTVPAGTTAQGCKEGAAVAGAAGAVCTMTTGSSGSDRGAARLTLVSTEVGTYSVTATVAGASITTGSPAQVVFVVGPVAMAALSVSAGTVSNDGIAAHTGSVLITDTAGHPIEAVPVTFVVSGSARLAGGVQTLTKATSVAGVAAVDVTDMVSETVSLTASLPGYPGVNVTGSPVGLVFGKLVPNLARSSLSVESVGPVVADGVASGVVLATVRDVNDSLVGGVEVVFSIPWMTTAHGCAEGAEVSIETSPAPIVCTVVTGTSGSNLGVARLVLTTTRATSVSVIAKLGGVAFTSGSPARIEFVAGPVAQVWFGVSEGLVANDGEDAHAVHAYVSDQFSNPVIGARVELSVTGSARLKDLAYGSPWIAGPASPLVVISSNASIVALASDLVEETVFVSARLPDYPDLVVTESPASIQFGPMADLVRSTVEITPAIPISPSHPCVVADEVDSFNVRIVTRDAAGALMGGRPVTVYEDMGVFLEPYGGDYVSGTSGANLGVVDLRLTSALAGPSRLFVYVRANDLAVSPVVVEFCHGPVDLEQSYWYQEWPYGPVLADGVATQRVLAYVVDAKRNPIGGVAVAFAVPAGTVAHGCLEGASVAGALGVVCTVVTEESEAELGLARLAFTATKAGSYRLTAKVGGVELSDGWMETIEFVPGPLAKAALSVSAGSVPRDGVAFHAGSVLVTDATGNPIVGVPVTFAVSGSARLTGGAQILTKVTTEAGLAAVEVTDLVQETVSLTASLPGNPAVMVTGSPAGMAFRLVPQYSAAWVSPAGSAVANGTASRVVSVTVRDVNNNLAVGVGVGFGVPAGVTATGCVEGARVTGGVGVVCTMLTGTSGTGLGVAQLTLVSTVAGSFEVTAQVGGVVLAGRGLVVFVAGPAARAVLTATTGRVANNGVDAHTGSVYVVDRFDNPVGNALVRFAVTGSGRLDGLISPRTLVTSSGGLVEVSVTDTVQETVSLTITVAGATLSGSPAGLQFGPGPADAARSTLVVAPTVGLTAANPCVVANGTASFTATVTVRDAAGGLVGGQTVGVLVPSQVRVAPVGVYTTPLTGVNAGLVRLTLTSTVVGEFDVVALLGVEPVAGSPQSVSFCAGPVVAARSSIVVSPVAVPADGASRGVVTATARDANSNPVAGVPVRFTMPVNTVAYGCLEGATVIGGAGRYCTKTSDASGVGVLEVSSTVAGTYSMAVQANAITITGSPARLTFVRP